MTTWIRAVPGDASATAAGVGSALARLATEPRPAVPDPSDVGLIVFDSISEEVLELVRGSSRGGLDRILAIGTSPVALGDLGPWPLLDAGASDVLTATDAAELADAVEARLSRWEETDALVRSPLVRETLAGRSPTWISLLRQIVEVGRFSDASVWLTGESGTGKNVVARLIHALDSRPMKGEFVTLDRRMLDPTRAGPGASGDGTEALDGSEPRSPWTAGSQVLGAADGGTLFLDGISGIPTELQEDILRAIEDPVYRPEGGGDWQRSEFRLICSATEEAHGSTGPGASAEDLTRRMTAWRCRLLPLREHRDDIPAIAEHLLRRFRPTLEDVRLDQALSAFLSNLDYPANAHDLGRLVRGIGIRHVGPGPVTVGAIPPGERPPLDSIDPSWHGEDLERAMRAAVYAGASLKAIGEVARDTAVRVALAQEDGDIRRAAKRLRVTIGTVASRSSGRSPGAAAPDASAGEPASIVELPEAELLGTAEDDVARGTGR